MELIDKAAVVAEITNIYDRNRSNGYIDVCNEIDDILSFLDTLETKEVDLEKEYKEFIDCDNGRSTFETAKYFFELGIKSKVE